MRSAVPATMLLRCFLAGKDERLTICHGTSRPAARALAAASSPSLMDVLPMDAAWWGAAVLPHMDVRTRRAFGATCVHARRFDRAAWALAQELELVAEELSWHDLQYVARLPLVAVRARNGRCDERLVYDDPGARVWTLPLRACRAIRSKMVGVPIWYGRPKRMQCMMSLRSYIHYSQTLYLGEDRDARLVEVLADVWATMHFAGGGRCAAPQRTNTASLDEWVAREDMQQRIRWCVSLQAREWALQCVPWPYLWSAVREHCDRTGHACRF